MQKPGIEAGKLKERVESRMALVDLTASAEDNPLESGQLDDLIKADLHYRNKQLKRLQEEVIDLEDLNEEGITLADFSLDDFRLDLLSYINANEEVLRSSPPGLYAVVETSEDLPKCQPGTIFCLRQRILGKIAEDQTKINPLRPYYLVYVLDSGDVRLSFVQPKAILQLFRELATPHSAGALWPLSSHVRL